MIDYHQNIGFFSHENSALCDQRYFHFAIPILVVVSDFLTESITTKISKYSAFQQKASRWLTKLIRKEDADPKNSSRQREPISLDAVQFGSERYAEYYAELE